MQTKNKNKVTDTIFAIGVFGMLIVAVLDFYNQYKANTEHIKLLKQQITETQYEKWKQCIDRSEGSDSECEECDEIYNPDKTFIYKK